MKPEKVTDNYPWREAYSGLQRSLIEEAESLEKLVNDVDACCAARELRRARLSGIRHAIAVADTLSRWEF